jgi:hypothetical protein
VGLFVFACMYVVFSRSTVVTCFAYLLCLSLSFCELPVFLTFPTGLALLPGFGTPWLIACRSVTLPFVAVTITVCLTCNCCACVTARFVSGLGVSGFVAGGYMFMSDIR